MKLPENLEEYNPVLIRRMVGTVRSRYNYALNEDDMDDITMEAWSRIHNPKVTYEEGNYTSRGAWVYARVRSAVDTYFKVKKVNVMKTFNACVQNQLGISSHKIYLFRTNEGDEGRIGDLVNEAYNRSISTTDAVDMIDFMYKLSNCHHTTQELVKAVISGEYKCLSSAISGLYNVGRTSAFKRKETVRNDLIRHGIGEKFFNE